MSNFDQLSSASSEASPRKRRESNASATSVESNVSVYRYHERRFDLKRESMETRHKCIRIVLIAVMVVVVLFSITNMLLEVLHHVDNSEEFGLHEHRAGQTLTVVLFNTVIMSCYLYGIYLTIKSNQEKEPATAMKKVFWIMAVISSLQLLGFVAVLTETISGVSTLGMTNSTQPSAVGREQLISRRTNDTCSGAFSSNEECYFDLNGQVYKVPLTLLITTGIICILHAGFTAMIYYYYNLRIRLEGLETDKELFLAQLIMKSSKGNEQRVSAFSALSKTFDSSEAPRVIQQSLAVDATG